MKNNPYGNVPKNILSRNFRPQLTPVLESFVSIRIESPPRKKKQKNNPRPLLLRLLPFLGIQINKTEEYCKHIPFCFCVLHAPDYVLVYSQADFRKCTTLLHIDLEDFPVKRSQVSVQISLLTTCEENKNFAIMEFDSPETCTVWHRALFALCFDRSLSEQSSTQY
jgi:hypothetical protein